MQVSPRFLERLGEYTSQGLNEKDKVIESESEAVDSLTAVTQVKHSFKINATGVSSPMKLPKRRVSDLLMTPSR
jgi:hypothetical protein